VTAERDDCAAVIHDFPLWSPTRRPAPDSMLHAPRSYEVRIGLDCGRRPSTGSETRLKESMSWCGLRSYSRQGDDRTKLYPSRDQTRRRGWGHRRKLFATSWTLRRGDPAWAVPVRRLVRSPAAAGLWPLAALHAATRHLAPGEQEQARNVGDQEKEYQKPRRG